MTYAAGTDIPELPRISDYAAHYARIQPGTEAMILGTTRIDYAELQARVDTCARALIASGIGKGDRVATLCTPHPDYFVIFLATASIGAIWVGLNPRYRRQELEYVLSDAMPKIAFSRTRIGERDYRPELEALCAAMPFLARLVILNGDPEPKSSAAMEAFLRAGRGVPDEILLARREAVEPADPALIVYTSGSTGRSKGALLPHRGLVKCSRVQCGIWNARPIRVQNFLPINHIGCVGDISCYALVGGGTIAFLEKFDPAAAMEEIVRDGITVWGGVPTTLQMSLALPGFAQYDLSRVQIVAWSGAAAPADLIRRLREITPRLSNAYGMTETVGSVTFVAPCDDIDVLAHTVGKPVDQYEVRIAGPDGSALDTGRPGEIQVRGDFVMKGYWNRPEATLETLDAEGWLHTGDVGLWREDGNIVLVGRMKEMFKSGGYNVYPREIEIVLEEHPAVDMAAVIGMPDPLYGEVGHAFVIKARAGALDRTALLEHCRARLANYKIPKSFAIADELPMLPIGKIDKRALRERLEGGDGRAQS